MSDGAVDARTITDNPDEQDAVARKIGALTAVAETPIELLALTRQFPADSTIRTVDGFIYEVAAPEAADAHVETAGGVKLYVKTKDGYYNLRAFGAVGDGVTDDTAARDAAQAAVPDTGGTIFVPKGKFRFTTPWKPKPLTRILGAGFTSAYLPSFFPEREIQNAELFFDGCDGLDFREGGGFSTVSEVLVTGTAGGYVGIRVIPGTYEVTPNVSLWRVGVRGFLDGVGVWLRENFRTFNWIDVQQCGLGVYWEGGINATTSYMIVENCAFGWIAVGSSRNNQVFGTIESCAKGAHGTSFPTSLVTPPADLLADIGFSAEDCEGGSALIGVSGSIISIYTEAVSSVIMYAGLDTVADFGGSYFNDMMPIGPNYKRPRNIVDAGRARSVSLQGIRVTTSNDRPNALFNLDTNRYHKTGFWYLFGGVGIYSGPMYENRVGSVVSPLSASLLHNATNLQLGAVARASATPTNAAAPSGGTLTLDALNRSVFIVTLTENVTVAASTTGLVDGQYLEIHFWQDSTGGRTVTWPSNFRLSWSDTGNTANKKTCIAFRYRMADSRWHQVSPQVPYHD